MDTQWGVQMLAPAYTGMREDIGRVTQKFPGSAENGSIYNHAAAFYVHALHHIGHGELAFSVMRKMLPGTEEADYIRRGQLPVFIPNYYRGAVDLHPRTAGRSSQLPNTGTVSWMLRSLLEDVFGLKGCREGLRIQPQFPDDWGSAQVRRRFRGATFGVEYQRGDCFAVVVDGECLTGNVVGNIQAGCHYRISVTLPTGGRT